MALFRKKSPKRNPANTAAAEMANSVSLCFVTDPDEFEVRAAVIAPPSPSSSDPASWALVTLGFEERDRMALYMDHRPDCLVRAAGVVGTREDAIREAQSWVGKGAQEIAFKNLPGVFQAQFLSAALGTEVRAGPAELSWAIPHESGVHLVREFPPKSQPTEMTPTPGEVSFVLLPDHAVRSLWSRADW